MTSKQRVLAALDHKQPDKLPMDFGSTAVTGVHVSCVAALREHFGLEKRPVKVIEPYQMLGEVDEELKQVMGIDVEGVFTSNTFFGFPNEGWKEWRTPFGQDVLVPEGFRTTVDGDGNTFIYPEGDTNATASGMMPKSGYFFDTIIRQEPIDEEKLDPEQNLEEFGPLSDEDLAHFEREVRRASATGRAVMATFGGTAFGDIALVPAPFLKHPKGIRDIEEWYVSTVIRRDYVLAVFERQCEIALANLERIHAVVGDAVDAVFVCGTDFGTQSSSFCSVETFEDLYMPFYERVNGWMHRNTNWRTFKHSCGAVEKFLGSFIECGFDILNPVQCSAVGMEPEHLKSRHGDRLVFWGGGVATQKVLPFGTPEEVRTQVLERCEIFAAGGGFIFNSIHNLQARAPMQNIVAMFDAVREFNGDK